MDYALGLGLTLLVEVPVVAVGAALLGAPTRRAAVLALVASLLTHPALWFVAAPVLDDGLGLWGLALAEGVVVAVEAAIYHRGLRPAINAGEALSLSLLANALSFGIGVLLLW
jgi:hypothetical protein